jgi:ferredoxin-NADP reductase
MRHEAHGVVSLTLEPVGDDTLPAWAPGAHIDITIGDGSTRQYSLSGSPESDSYRIAVLREEVSRGGSVYVHDDVRVGAVIEVGGPRNHFALEEAADYRFIAGGIGITPLLPMLARLTAAGQSWSLHYFGRSRTTMAFLSELAPYGDRVTVVAKDEASGVPIAAALTGATTESLVYVCGPARLIDGVREAADAASLAGRVRAELFAAPEPDSSLAASDGFTVRLTRSDIELAIPADRSILDVVLEAGIDVLHDCAEGICGSCETAVVSGSIEHRDYVLTDREKTAGDCMMICVSRASCPVLELAL